jgi:uncharacterized DUF497 family protein
LIFEWNEAKRRSNLLKHGFDFADCAKVFAGPTYTVRDDRFDYGEPRLMVFGLLGARVVAVACTETEDVIRLITMRRATRHEQTLFFTFLKDGL